MRLLLSLLTITLALVNFAGGQASLPYETSFEPEEGFTNETPLSGDWTTTDASIVTADDVAQSGTQSVRITSANPENIISLAFDPAGNSILFVDYYMQLTASALPGLPSFTQPETTAILAVQPYLTDSGEWVFLDGDGVGSGKWFTVGETTPLDGSNRTDWHRITLRFDLTSNLWDAYIDEKLLAVNLGFVEALIAGSEAINIYGNSVGVAYMDTFSLATTNPLFTDTDLDGIPDAFESSNGLNLAINDRDLDPDLDGLTNVEEYAYETDPSVFNADEGALNEVLYNRTNWYIDVVNGDDAAGNGSQTSSLQSLSALLAINATNPGYVGEGDTVYLAAGNYGTGLDVIAIAGLTLEGTLDANDEPLTQMGNLEITAENVTVKNLNFNNTSLELKNVSGVLVTNNLFTGNTGISLSLLGSSNNTISYNRFESAQYHSVKLSWDSSAEAVSNDNQFIRNYFTHRTSAVTNESIYCTYSAGNNNSLNSRNRFIECAFEEIVSGNLTRVITDEGTWWMTDATAHPYQYSVRFEDCYFKRADRTAAFSEFVITAGWPDLAWRWDELVNDTWVSMNNEYALTGDYNDWDLEPRIQFIDSDGNGSIIETSHNAGLLISGNSAPEITSAAITSVDEGSLYSYTITATDMDAGDVVTLSAPQLPAWLSFDGTTLSGTPTPTEIGSHTVEIVASDISGATDTHLFTITVSIASVTTPANLDYVSVLFDSNYAYTYAGPVSGTVRGLGSDYADYSIEIISNTDFPYLIDTVDVNADGSWSIGHVGTGQKIARLYSKTDTETVLAEVYGEGLNNPSGSPDSYVPHNDAPGLDAISSPITLEENAGEQTLVLTGIHDGDHGTQAISIHAVSDNPSLIANPVVTYDSANSPETATLRFTPQGNTNGTAIITLTLQDDGGTEVVGGTTIWRRVAGKDTKTVSFEIIVGTGGSSNRAPEITSTAITSVDVDNVYSYTVAASDPDVGDTVTLSVPQLPTWLSFDGTALSGTPTATEVGTHSVEIVATDLSGATESQVFEITVNAVSVSIPANLDYVSVLFDIDYAYTYAGSIGGTVRGLGSDYADYSIQVIANVDTEYPIGTVDINADGSWSIGHVGTGQKIARLYSKTDTETVLAEVYGEGLNNASGSPESYANQNDAPGLDAISGPITVAENAGEQTIALTGIHDGDHGVQTISINAVSDNPSLIANPVVTYDSVSSPETATFRFTPKSNTSGTATITLTLQDDGGTEFVGGTTWWRRLTGKDTKEVSFEIIVGSGGSGNSAPEITSAAITSIDEGSLYSYTIIAIDPDADDTITLSTPQLPSWLSFDGVTLSGTPTSVEVGSHTVEIIATDSSNATYTQSFILTVNAAGVATPADLDHTFILFDTDYAYSYSGSISGTVYGLGSDYADYSIEVIANTDFPYSMGTVDINADGSWSIDYASAGQKIARLYSKADTATVLAEVHGEGLTNFGTYVNQNDAPGLDAISSPLTIVENAAEQTLVLTGIHDGDHGTQAISISAISDNTALIADPVISYDSVNSSDTATLSFTPKSGLTGTVTITLTLQDDGGVEIVGGTTGWRRVDGEDTKTVSFDVVVGTGVPGNRAPEITSMPITFAVEGSSYSYTVAASDADIDDAITLSAQQLPSWLSFDGTILSGTPTSAEVGTHTVKIVAMDLPGAIGVQTFAVTVNIALDTDSDGLDDTFEVNVYGTDPLRSDTDGDGIEDGDEVSYGLDPLTNDLMFDADGDGYPNIYELEFGTDVADSVIYPTLPTFRVNQDGTQDFTKIQDAIDAVTEDYSIIWIDPETYDISSDGNNYRNFHIGLNDPSMLIISSPTAFGSTNSSNTILDGQGVRQVGWIENNRSALVGFTIKNGANNPYGGGINASGNETFIAKCEIYDNTSNSLGGGLGLFGDNSVVDSCKIYNNRSINGGSIGIRYASEARIQNTLISGNEATSRGGGIYFDSNTSGELIHVTIYNNVAPQGDEIYNTYKNAADLVLVNSILWNGVGDTNVIKGTSVTAGYSIICGTYGYIDDGNVSNADPRLSFEGMLTSSSITAIDQGISIQVPNDIHGEVRPEEGGYDIGADEYTDSDGDNFPDWLEELGVDPSGDGDADNLTNLDEYQAGTDRFNPDTDGDTLKDGDELIVGLDPNTSNDLELISADNNADGLADNLGLYLGYALLDLDVDDDGINNATEIELGSNPFEVDTDADGVEDGVDAFPLDSTRSIQPTNEVPPVIVLTKPEFALSL